MSSKFDPKTGWSNAKLTAEEVRQIRQRYLPGTNRGALAKEYGVTKRTITNVVRRISWGWLDPPAIDTSDW